MSTLKDSYGTRNNLALDRLINGANDFFPNLWWAVITVESADNFNDIFSTGWNEKVFDTDSKAVKAAMSANSFSVRLEDFTIPELQYNTTDLHYGNRTIKKIVNSFNMNKKLSLNFPLDQNMLLLRLFSQASNDFSVRDNYELYGTDSWDTYNRHLCNIFPVMRSASQYDLTGSSVDESKRARFSITILYADATNTLFTTYANFLAWKFYDVHFLGRENAITFNNDPSATPLKMSVPFIYKKMVRIHDTSGYAELGDYLIAEMQDQLDPTNYGRNDFYSVD